MNKLSQKWIIVTNIFAILLVLCTSKVNGGDLQRRREAVRLFVNKQYAKALPLFAQLVSNHPENYKFNYYYGTCLLIADKDKAKAVEHLETAIKSPKSPEETYYYLAKAYHMNYMFDEGIRAIAEFNKMSKEKQRHKYKTGEVAECIYNARRILDSAQNKMVKEYISATPEDFFSKYVFEGNYGKILTMPNEIKTRKSDDENPTIFLSADGGTMFYSALCNESGSRDIFRVLKSADGTWGQPERLDAAVNTNKDELFPTCSPDGHVLYFSSMGHNSTGGFDIYKSVYIRADNKWTTAENMGSPYNSPYDDYNFVPSGPDKMAYFTSTRNCNWGQLMVCKIDYNSGEQIPIELNGRLSCINNPEIKQAKIMVTKVDNDSMVAMVNSDAKNGSYTIMLPGAGAYRFDVVAQGFQPHSQVATFSEFSDKYFIQKIYLSRDQSGMEDMAINNLRESDALKLDEKLTAMEDENGANEISVSDILNTAVKPECPASIGTATDGASMASGAAANAKDPSMHSGTASTAGLEYRIQIGAFKTTPISESRRKLSKKTKNPLVIDNYDKKWNRFYIGHEDTYEKAKKLKQVLLLAGFKDAFIVAYKNNQPVKLQAEIDNSK